MRTPPEFPKSFIPIDEFTPTHMGAKSNNIKILRDSLDSWIELPQSGCIPFKMMEYSLGLEPEVNENLDKLIKRLERCKNVDRMNKILFKCKDLVMGLKFHDHDSHHSYLKAQLLQFGVAPNDFA